MASTVSFSPTNVQMLQARSSHNHAAFRTCSAVPRTGPRLRSTAIRVSSLQEVSAVIIALSGRTIEECRADAAAEKFPALQLFVRPKTPEGTSETRLHKWCDNGLIANTRHLNFTASIFIFMSCHVKAPSLQSKTACP
jgi:hypothetical protein